MFVLAGFFWRTYIADDPLKLFHFVRDDHFSQPRHGKHHGVLQVNGKFRVQAFITFQQCLHRRHHVWRMLQGGLWEIVIAYMAGNSF